MGGRYLGATPIPVSRTLIGHLEVASRPPLWSQTLMSLPYLNGTLLGSADLHIHALYAHSRTFGHFTHLPAITHFRPLYALTG